MSLQPSGSHIHISNWNIHGGIGGQGGEGDKRGGTGGAGEGPRVTYQVKAKNFTTIHNLSELTPVEQQQESTIEKADPGLLRCSPPSQLFCGREDILAEMTQYFSKGIGERHIYVLHGLGGSGKTQIALKFLDIANRSMPPRFTRQFFINSNSGHIIEAAFINIAVSHKAGKTAEDGKNWLISHIEEWVLVFDNADDPSIDLFPFFPKCTHGNIIITSRNPLLATHGPKSTSRVGYLDKTSAMQLLLQRAGKEETTNSISAASEIVKTLGYLPLAIIQAGAYISKFDCLHKYPSLYKDNHARALRHRPTQSHDDYSHTVYTTWQISFDQLSQVAARFLQLCSLMHHNGIPEDIFPQASSFKGNDDVDETELIANAREFLSHFLSDAGDWDQYKLMETIAEIEEYSLLNRDSSRDTLSIHPLVALWCRDTLNDIVVAEECMADIVGMAVSFMDDDHLYQSGLMPHIDTLIKRPGMIKPMFHEKYAGTYFIFGRFNEAELLQRALLNHQSRYLGTNHAATLHATTCLTATYRAMGRYGDAEPLERAVLTEQKQLHGDDHPDTLLAMAHLAATTHALGNYPEAMQLKSFVLEKRKQLHGDDDLYTLMAMANLAVTHRKLGQYPEAQSLESNVLEKRQKILGNDHPETLRAMSNLAATYFQLGMYQETEALECAVLERRIQLFGSDYPDTLYAMSNLAGTYRQMQRYHEAAHLETTVLQRRKQLFGNDHIQTLRPMSNLASTYCEMGNLQEAEVLAIAVLGRRKQLWGNEHVDTLWSKAILAQIFHKQGRYQEAQALELTVLEKRKQVLGTAHPDTLQASENLARTYKKLRRHQEAHLPGGSKHLKRHLSNPPTLLKPDILALIDQMDGVMVGRESNENDID
ncbi:hypothetical protein FB45DRAFT_58845 [Roridomyces roridus]|uniref:DUF7779 domain-containing protein n=1 Tax=Roridomyces roridus TaxID=1738132 RepID=A0AAD7BQ10_9AGAR|nr:hypothetical protein FB45DRAFT_58845 [Roridomyces roridus]